MTSKISRTYGIFFGFMKYVSFTALKSIIMGLPEDLS